MPSTVGTPAQITITGAAAATIPARFTATHAQLSLDGALAVVGPGTGTTLSVTSPTLDRLRRFDRLMSGDEVDTRYQLIWQRTMEAIEDAFAALTLQVADNTALLNRIAAAQDLAAAANETATDTNDAVSIANSYVSPVDLLTAANDGSITIDAHTRYYGNGSSVSVNSGSVTGFAGGDYVTVYYKDAARVGGAVTYVGTTNAVAQKGDVHVVGQATIPASGEPPATGSSTASPGYKPPTGTPTYDPDYIEP